MFLVELVWRSITLARLICCGLDLVRVGSACVGVDKIGLGK